MRFYTNGVLFNVCFLCITGSGGSVAGVGGAVHGVLAAEYGGRNEEEERR